MRVAGFAPFERFSEFGVRKDRSQCCELVTSKVKDGGVFVDSAEPHRASTPFSNSTIRTDSSRPLSAGPSKELLRPLGPGYPPRRTDPLRREEVWEGLGLPLCSRWV